MVHFLLPPPPPFRPLCSVPPQGDGAAGGCPDRRRRPDPAPEKNG
jgi:hypothetical protein